MIWFIGFIAAVLSLSYFAVCGIRYLAERHEILDVPNERSSHTQSMPRGGGLAIVVLTLGGAWLYASFNPLLARPSLLGYTIGAILIVAISWYDDLRSQPNWLRFTIHSIGALLAIYGFGYLHLSSILNANPLVTRWIDLIITFLWLVGLTNAYNFMDGIDGIAGGQAVVAGLGWAALGSLTGQRFVFALGLILAASSLGFLFHNWQPARIFMGDVGSAFLGYTFAVMPLIFDSHLSVPVHGLGPFVAGNLFVWPFIFDSTFTFLRRLYLRENVFSAHRSHLYQRLVIIGFTHGFVALLYSGLAVLGALLALAWVLRWRNSISAVAVLLPLLCLGLWIFVIRCEDKAATRSHSRMPPYVDPA